ncbi:calcium-binding protein [Nitrosomonas sp.]|uniref:calcium-binding protein n=1 Tax=Nitrosomonas sp. TaxID=42353 RepID=UPI00374DD8CE
MGITKTLRENLGSGTINSTLEYIDGIPFVGLGSAGFDDDDFLFIGDDLDNFDLIGGAGHDEIKGEGGKDVLEGGAGNDILKGGDGNDDLDGQEGTEKLFGGDGNDILRAGGSIPANTPVPPGQPAGDYDRLDGGSGKDTFGFYGVGTFEIADFTIDEDRLFFDSEILGIHSFSELAPFITNVTDNGDSGFTVEFVGGAATIELVGVNINSITTDMIVYTL